MKTLSWNCRGLNSPTGLAIPFLKRLIPSLAIDFIFLSETKCSIDVLKPTFSALGLSDCNGVDSTDASGGFLFAGVVELMFQSCLRTLIMYSVTSLMN